MGKKWDGLLAAAIVSAGLGAFVVVLLPAIPMDEIAQGLATDEPDDSKAGPTLTFGFSKLALCAGLNLLIGFLAAIAIHRVVKRSIACGSTTLWRSGVVLGLGALLVLYTRWVEFLSFRELAQAASVYPEMLLDALAPTYPIRWFASVVLLAGFVCLLFELLGAKRQTLKTLSDSGQGNGVALAKRAFGFSLACATVAFSLGLGVSSLGAYGCDRRLASVVMGPAELAMHVSRTIVFNGTAMLALLFISVLMVVAIHPAIRTPVQPNMEN